MDTRLREEQAGVRPGRSCTDQIFNKVTKIDVVLETFWKEKTREAQTHKGGVSKQINPISRLIAPCLVNVDC